MPKIVRNNKDALCKGGGVDILNACPDISLKAYVMFLAAHGFIGCRSIIYIRQRSWPRIKTAV
ncbi:MAG: hypothetical protein WBQ25_12560 [Nitrososphaeraceae archaeon]